MNRLYFGDCFTVMQSMPSQSVDLIYLDPPFNSKKQYNAIYKDETGRPLPDQVEAFCDLFTLDAETERAITHMPVLMREEGIDDDVVEFWRIWMNVLRRTNPRLLAYLAYMVQRLLVMKRLLKPTGSIYLHCDPTASHYIKVMLDGVFGHDNFRNEIVWKRTSSLSDAKRLGAVHDVILLYGKSPTIVWNPSYQPYDPKYLETHYRRQDADGRRYRTDNVTAGGLTGGGYEYEWNEITKSWRYPETRMRELDGMGRLHYTRSGSPEYIRYLDEMPGTPLQDVWIDIAPINSQAKERLGYPTQKPLALLERIIKASSRGRHGTGSFLWLCHHLGGSPQPQPTLDWHRHRFHAVKRVAKIRLQDRLGLLESRDFTIEGIPRNLEEARDLWQRDKYHFQKWTVEQVNGFVTAKRTADGGIDGWLYFTVPGKRELQSMVLEVKGGRNVNIGDVRSLYGVLEAGEAEMASLIVLEPLGDRKRRNFDQFMAQAGDMEIQGVCYQRMQLLDVASILDGHRFVTPSVMGRTEPQPVFSYGFISP